MPIDSTTTFNAVVITCVCSLGEFGKHFVQQGTTQAARDGDTSVVRLPFPFTPTNPEIAEVISRVKAGTAHAYYYDQSANPEIFARVDQAPTAFWGFHARHPFWPDDGYKMLDRIPTKGDLEESTNSRLFKFDGGFEPQRQGVASSTYNYPLSEWQAYRSGPFIDMLLTVPASLELQQTELDTYPPARALRNWFEDNRRSASPLPINLAAPWPGVGLEWDTNPTNLNPDLGGPNDQLVLQRAGIGLTSSPGTTDVIAIRISFNVTQTLTGITFEEALTWLREQLRTLSIAIPGSGQSTDSPVGKTDSTLKGSVIELDGGLIKMPGGLLLGQWKDPGDDDIRILPFSTEWGRTIDHGKLVDRTTGTGKRSPRPEEFPRVKVVHYAGSVASNFQFETPDLFVGYPGADREITIHNKATEEVDYAIHKWGTTDTLLLNLHQGEKARFLATLDIDGNEELVSLKTPVRRQTTDGTAHDGIPAGKNYTRTIGGLDYDLFPFHVATTPPPLYNDTDAFGAGTGTLGADVDLDTVSNFVETPETVITKHAGDIEIACSYAIEVTGNGNVGGGHDCLLIRKRGDEIEIFDRHWQPVLSGIGNGRTYTIYFRDRAEVGDIYEIFWAITSHSLNLQTGLRVVNVQRRFTLTPEVELTV